MESVIIGNPNSGSTGDEGYLERFAEILRDGGLQVRVLNTEHPDHATELAAASSDKLVIAAGGNGTVNEVINGLSGCDVRRPAAGHGQCAGSRARSTAGL